MDRRRILELLEEVRNGAVAVEEAAEALRRLPFEKLGEEVVVDHHRPLRSGVPEVVLGEWKSAEQIAEILAALAASGGGALATRVDADKAARVLALVDGGVHHEVARAVIIPPDDGAAHNRPGTIAVACAGTSDRPVAEEAAVTLEFFGHEVDRVTDIGVAGLQRVVASAERLRRADVAVVVAGMEGALPSVVAGLVDRPVIAVPTSVGYGVGLGGYAAMIGMLSSCAPGVTVVNIDNGFGAAVAASLIARRTV